MDRYELLSRLTNNYKYLDFQDNQYSKRNRKDVEYETADSGVAILW